MANVPYDAHAWYEEGERVKGWFGETGEYYNCTIVTRHVPWGCIEADLVKDDPTKFQYDIKWDDEDERDWHKKPAHHFRPMRRKKYAWQAAPKKKIFVDGKVTIGTESDDESTTSTSDDDGKEGDDKEEAGPEEHNLPLVLHAAASNADEDACKRAKEIFLVDVEEMLKSRDNEDKGMSLLQLI